MWPLKKRLSLGRKQRERPWYDDYEEDDERYGYRSGMYEDKPFTPHTGWYMTGNADFVYQFQGETQDYTACDMECGYCGRCSYWWLVSRNTLIPTCSQFQSQPWSRLSKIIRSLHFRKLDSLLHRFSSFGFPNCGWNPIDFGCRVSTSSWPPTHTPVQSP